MRPAIKQFELTTVDFAIGQEGFQFNLLPPVQSTPGEVARTAAIPAGLNVVLGDTGDNLLQGTAARDLLYGNRGMDTLAGGAGNDILIGGRDADTYEISVITGGNDLIADLGSAPVINGAFGSSNLDTIKLTGFTSLTQAVHSIDIEILGDDLIIQFDNPLAPGETGQVTVRNHFASGKFGVEELVFAIGSSETVFHISQLSGDDFTYSVHSGPDQGGEDIVLGTHASDQIYGGIGTDIMFGGAGVDHFMFHDEEEHGGGDDIILDFNLSLDQLDYTEIKTLDRSGVTVADNALGNAVVSSAYGNVELAGIATAEIDDGIFTFF